MRVNTVKQGSIQKGRSTKHPANIFNVVVAEHQLQYLTLLSRKPLPASEWGVM